MWDVMKSGVFALTLTLSLAQSVDSSRLMSVFTGDENKAKTKTSVSLSDVNDYEVSTAPPPKQETFNWLDKLWTTSTEAPVADPRFQPVINSPMAINDGGYVVGVNGRIVSRIESSENGEELNQRWQSQRPWEEDGEGSRNSEAVPNGGTHYDSNGDSGNVINGNLGASHRVTHGLTPDSMTQEIEDLKKETADLLEELMTTNSLRIEDLTHDDSELSSSNHVQHHLATDHASTDLDGASSHLPHMVTQDDSDSLAMTHKKSHESQTVTPDANSLNTQVSKSGSNSELLSTSQDESYESPVTLTRSETVTPGVDTVLDFKRLREEHSHLDIEDLVLHLQTQLHESQTSHVRTRSILNTLEEKQESLENDLGTLKEEIRQLRGAQKTDHVSLESQKTEVENNAWGLTNVKSNQNQLIADVQGLKAWLSTHNDTLLQLEQLSWSREVTQLNQGSFLQELSQDIQELTETAKEDRHEINHLRHLVREKLGHDAHPNRISKVLDKVDIANGSQESLAQFQQWEIRAAELEEMSNMVEHQLREINQKDVQIQKKVNGMDFRFGQYDAQFSKLYALFYNLSLQMSTLENRMLSQKQQAVESELGSLQQSFFNFTQQLLTMEQWHQANRNVLTNTSRSQSHLSEMLGEHDDRIDNVENLFQDHQSHIKLRHNKVSRTLTLINDTVAGLQKSMKDHRSKASNVFKHVDEELETFRGQIQSNSDRLLHVEVKVLNESLQKCKKSNSDLRQDMKLSDFSNDLTKVGGRVHDHTSQISRLDKGVSRLFQELGTVTKTTSSMLSDITELLHLIPDIASLQREVDNFIAQLPQDCTEVAESTNARFSKLYLIKPGKSPSSVQTFCEFDDVENSEWTYIQRRVDGTVTFDRSWDEYAEGFGSPDTEFWIGNDYLHQLTNQGPYSLRIDMWDLQNQYLYAEYDVFKVADREANYKLNLEGYHGNATDAFKYGNFMPFSTPNMDHDFSSTHCAKFYTAGWWYKHCHYANLNGRYTVGVVWFNNDLDEWMQLKKTTMKIRRIDTTGLQKP